MYQKFKTLNVAVSLALLPMATHAFDQGDITLRGFGTISAVHSGTDSGDFRSSITQPKGSGASTQFDFGVDTRIGLQVDAKLTNALTATVQTVTERDEWGGFGTGFEWANLKYAITPELSVKAGRVTLPVFMVSDYRKVSYAMPFVRPPVEVYGNVPFSALDGVNVEYNTNINNTVVNIQGEFGTSAENIPANGVINHVVAKRNIVLNTTIERGYLQGRIGYVHSHIDYGGDKIDAIFNGLQSFAQKTKGLAISGQALDLLDKYQCAKASSTFLGLGLSYDPGDWFIQGEFTRRKSESFITPTKAWYVTTGARNGAWTTYWGISKVMVDREIVEPGMTTKGLPPALAVPAAALNSGVNQLLKATSYGQDTLTIGARWDVMKNTALKVQMDRTRLDPNTGSFFVNGQANLPGSIVNTYSASLDFVF